MRSGIRVNTCSARFSRPSLRVHTFDSGCAQNPTRGQPVLAGAGVVAAGGGHEQADGCKRAAEAVRSAADNNDAESRDGVTERMAVCQREAKATGLPELLRQASCQASMSIREHACFCVSEHPCKGKSNLRCSFQLLLLSANSIAPA